jgi:hypothetical protein
MIRGFEDFLRENAKSTSESLLQKLTALVSIKNVKDFSSVKKVNLKKYAPVLETAFAEALRDYEIPVTKPVSANEDASMMLSYSAVAYMKYDMVEDKYVKSILKKSSIAEKFAEAFSLLKKLDWENLRLYANCYQDCYRLIGAIFQTATSSNKSSREEITACITFLHEIGFAKEKLTEEAKKSLMNEIRYLEDRPERREEIIDFYREIYPEMVKDLRGMQTGDKTGIT